MRNREKLLETNISRLFSPVSYRESYIDIILKFTFRPSRKMAIPSGAVVVRIFGI
jgi:hypothetical protein